MGVNLYTQTQGFVIHGCTPLPWIASQSFRYASRGVRACRVSSPRSDVHHAPGSPS